jgi:hypothetical protein
MDDAVERALEDPIGAVLRGMPPDQFLVLSARQGDATPREAARERVRAWAAETGSEADFEDLDVLAEALAEELYDRGDALAFGLMVASHPFGHETVAAAWQVAYGRVPGTMAVGRALSGHLASLTPDDDAADDAFGSREQVLAGRWPWVVGVSAAACQLRGADGEGWALERRGGRLALRQLD